MTTKLYIQIGFDVIGEDAADAARQMAESIDAGSLDLAMLATLRDEYRQIALDWRFTAVNASAETAQGGAL